MVTSANCVASQHDYVVVGAGSSGAVLASRLSENGRYSVALLEAGESAHWLTRVPAGAARLIKHPLLNWNYATRVQSALNGRSIAVPRGRMLGGSSAINGMVFVRGQALDFDGWAQTGLSGWDYDSVLPFFQKMESFSGGQDRWRGGSGPLNVSVVSDENSLFDALFTSGAEAGLPRNPDYNGESQDGMALTQATIHKGRRMSVARCYLEPAAGRSNLELFTRMRAQSLTFDGGRCTGVVAQGPGGRHEFVANREVVVAAGAIASPQLLELSGIGSPAVLTAVGIDVRVARESVGQNLREHLCPRLGWGVETLGATYNEQARGLRGAGQLLRYLTMGRGLLAQPVAPMLGFARSREGLAAPDLQLHFMPYSYKRNGRLDTRPGFTALVYALRPESRGTVHLCSADPLESPDIDFNFLDNELDRQVTIAGVRLTRQLVGGTAMARFIRQEFKPGKDVTTDDEILAWVRASAETAYHPVGTCRMGSDDNAVVDQRLRVKGIDGLRVADASIMPTLVSGNTNAACIMIGEKAAHMVLEDAATG